MSFNYGMRSVILIMIFSLYGCTSYKWVKEGKTDLEMQKALTSCHAKALVSLPPDNKVHGSNTQNEKYKYKSDDDDDDDDDGKKSSSKYENTSYNISDANDNSRNILIDDCMLSNDWRRIEIQQ